MCPVPEYFDADNPSHRRRADLADFEADRRDSVRLGLSESLVLVPSSALEVLVQEVDGRRFHRNDGLCPDGAEGHDSRDPLCLVCAALDGLNATLENT